MPTLFFPLKPNARLSGRRPARVGVKRPACPPVRSNRGLGITPVHRHPPRHWLSPVALLECSDDFR